MKPHTCDQCGKGKPAKGYFWNYEKDDGYIYLCPDCVESLKFSGYTLIKD